MKKIFLIVFILAALVGCKDKLELKPRTSIVLPTTNKDLELLLENTNVLNLAPVLPQLSADEYFIPTLQEWQALTSVVGRTASIWQSDIYQGQKNQFSDWNVLYTAVFYCNNVLDVLNKQGIDDNIDKKILRGWALFARSYAFYDLASTFSKAYNSTTSKNDLGIPLKLNANVDEIVQRSTLEETYEQITKDLIEASELLQRDIIPGFRNRPSKAAAYAMLARVYLSMGNYSEAEVYADKTLAIYSKLTDFNLLNKTATSAFTFDSEEVMYFSRLGSEAVQLTNGLKTSYGIDPTLIALYDPSDLRLPIYFQKNTIGNYNIKPINSLSRPAFTGLATDEIYLIKAECLARRNEVALALDYLNKLYATRWNKAVLFQKIMAATPEVALNEVLKERRRALVWRSLRWTDLKRLNLEGRNLTLTRKLDDQIYTLTPNNSRYVLPIPADEIALSGIQQNVR